MLLMAQFADRVADFDWDGDGDATDPPGIWEDPAFRAWVDRFYQLVTPIGALANYGQGNGIDARSASVLVWMFTEAAHRIPAEEGRYLEAAQRVLHFQERRLRPWIDPDDPHDEMAETMNGQVGLVMAHRAGQTAGTAADQPDDPGSLYTLRRYGEEDPASIVHSEPFRWATGGTVPAPMWSREPDGHTAQYVPDKLLLRSPGGPDGLTFVFNLLAGYKHGFPELGALTFASDRGSVLAAPGPYPYHVYRSDSADHPKMSSVPLLQHYSGGDADWERRGDHVHFPLFHDSKDATVATAEFQGGDLHGYGVDQSRHFVFAKNGFLWVRDRFALAAAGPLHVSAGPVWHVQDVVEEQQGAAGRWFDFFHRVPRTNVSHLRNPKRHAVMYLLDRAGHVTDGYLEKEYLPLGGTSGDPWQDMNATCKADLQANRTKATNPECRAAPPFILSQRWTGELSGSAERWFDTVILPHDGGDAAAVAGGIRLLDQGAAHAALEITTPGGDVWTVVDNPGGVDVCGEKSEGECTRTLTDARYLVHRQDAAAAKEGSLVASQATFIDVGSYDLAYGQASDVEFQQFVAEDDGYLTGASTVVVQTAAPTHWVGDSAAGAALQAIVSFDTSEVPDAATITGAELLLVRHPAQLGDPFGDLSFGQGSVEVDVVNGWFGASPAIEADDFDPVMAPGVADLVPGPYVATASLGAAADALVNKTGKTQFRVRFIIPSNGDGEWDVTFFRSLEDPDPYYHPTLRVHYED